MQGDLSFPDQEQDPGNPRYNKQGDHKGRPPCELVIDFFQGGHEEKRSDEKQSSAQKVHALHGLADILAQGESFAGIGCCMIGKPVREREDDHQSSKCSRWYAKGTLAREVGETFLALTSIKRPISTLTID